MPGAIPELFYNTLHRFNYVSGCQPDKVGIVLVYLVYLNHFKGRIAPMGGEMFTAIVLSFSLIFVGILMGYALLKIQGDEEESL